VCVSGLDPNGSPFDLFRSIKINGREGSKVELTPSEIDSPEVSIELTFQGHYNEQKLTL